MKMAENTVAELIALVRGLHDKLDEHVQDEMHRMLQLESIIERLVMAFPDDNLEAHRLYHINRMKQAVKEEAIADTVKKELVKWGSIAAAGFIAYAIWKNFLFYVFMGHP